jgi:hypothetical protein
MCAASLVTISTSCLGVRDAPCIWSTRRATFSSASRLGLPLGSQSEPSPTGMPSEMARRGAGGLAV